MSNNSSGLSDTAEEDEAKRTIRNTILVFEVAVVPVIVCGNILIISAVCRFKWLRSPSNVMIVALAVGDLMMGGIYMPTKIVFSNYLYLFMDRVPCLINIFISYLSVMCAMLFLSVLSVERFYAVQFPFHYHSSVTVTRSVVCCAAIFAVAVCVALPILCGIDLWAPGKICFNTNILPAYYVWAMVSVIFVVHLAGFVCFLRVLAAEVLMRLRDRNQDETVRRRQDSLKSTLVLTVYFFSLLCWIPQLVFLFISVFTPKLTSLLGLRIVSLLGVCSSGVNCFIYGIKNRSFKKAFREIFGCKSQEVDVVTEANTNDEIF